MMNVGEWERRFVEEAPMALVEVVLTTVEVDGEVVGEIVGETVLGIQRVEEILVEDGEEAVHLQRGEAALVEGGRKILMLHREKDVGLAVVAKGEALPRVVDLLVEDGEVEGGIQREERVPMEVGVVEVLPHQRALREVVEVVVVEEGEGLQRKVVEALVEGGEVEPRLHKLEEGAVDMVAVVVVVALMEEMPLPMGVRVGGKAGEGLLPKKVGERKVEGKGATRRKVEVEVKEVVEVEKAEWEEVEVEVDKVSVHLTQIVLQVTLSALSMDSASANPTNQEARTAGGREWVEMGGDRVERGPKEKVEGEEGEEVVKGRAQLTATAPLRTLFALSTRIFLFFFQRMSKLTISSAFKVGFLSVRVLPAGRIRLLGRWRRKSARWKMRIRRRLPSH